MEFLFDVFVDLCMILLKCMVYDEKRFIVAQREVEKKAKKMKFGNNKNLIKKEKKIFLKKKKVKKF
jgi:hypothetical protein